MTPASHVLVGIAIGRISGDYTTAILVSTLVDVDHLVPFVRHGVFRSRKAFFDTIFGKVPSRGDERGYLHNVFIALTLSALVFFIDKPVGLTFLTAYIGHLLLDALDTSDFWPLYPNKRFTLRGSVKYLSLREFVFDVAIIAIIVLLFLFVG